MRSRCVRTPITRGNPCACRMFRNSNVSISKPYDASVSSSTKSATLAMSIIALRSLGHSKNVRRRFFPETTVMGPFTVCRDRLE